MTKPLTFYIVFHKEIVADSVASFTDDEKRDMLRWIAVNDKIPKTIPPTIPRECVMNESDFADFCPFYQISKINENSVIHHFVHNPELLDGSKYIGLGQYDMGLDGEKFRKLKDALTTTDKRCAFLPFLYDSRLLFDPHMPDFWYNCVIAPYNARYGTSHTIHTVLEHKYIPLLNCFILPADLWKEMAQFSRFITPKIISGLNYDITHLGGTLERVHGVFILFAISENKLDLVSDFSGLTHR